VEISENSPGMSSLTDKVDDLFSAWNKPDSPGCVIAIIHIGKLVYGRGYGMANLEHDVPLSLKSVLEIASTTKQFVAMSTALLARQGKLALDDAIQKYLPELRCYENAITLRHLIHHTSGLSDHLYIGYWAGFNFENHYQFDEVIDLISRQKVLNFQPGEEHQYSNTGYLLLAEISSACLASDCASNFPPQNWKPKSASTGARRVDASGSWQCRRVS
jgi:CubicO group peptidase (beta-lactamase class C family)